MGRDFTREQLDEFRKRCSVSPPAEKRKTSERNILLEDPGIDTDVETLWHKSAPPAVHPNPISEDDIGHYWPWETRRCVIADMDIIDAYYNCLNGPPPSFRQAGPRRFLHFKPDETQVAIVTSGGIAPGLNVVVHALVDRHYSYGTRMIYGFHNGFWGVLENDWELLKPETTLEWIHRGGTALGTLREKQDNQIDLDGVVQQLRDRRIKILYVVGGDGSSRAAHEIWSRCRNHGWEIAVAVVPKTMDNDLLWTWASFGFDTAVAEATRIIDVLHEEAKSNNRICVVKLFGRESGFVAAMASLASGEPDAVLIPEESPIDVERLIDHLTPKVNTQHHALIVMGEGIDIDLTTLKNRLQQYFFNRSARLPNRYDVFDNEPRHVVRAGPANPSDQIFCHRLAAFAVDSTLAGFTCFMISWWLTEYVLVPLRLVIGHRKRLPTGSSLWKAVRSMTRQPCFTADVPTAVEPEEPAYASVDGRR